MSWSKLSAGLGQRWLAANADPGFPGFGGDQALVRLPDIGLALAAANGDAAINQVVLDGDPGRSVSMTGTRSLDLFAATDPYGRPVSLHRVKLLVVANFSTDDAAVLYWGPDATTGWDAPTGGAASPARRPAYPGYADSLGRVIPGVDLFVAPGLTGAVVDATHRHVLLDAGAKTIPYAVLAFGFDA